MLLSVYYLLAISYGWRETRIKSVSRYLHGIPVLGFAGAFASIPHITHAFLGCTVLPPPQGDEYWPVYLIVVPVALALLIATVNMLLVFQAFRRTMKKAQNWRMSGASERYESDGGEATTRQSRGNNRFQARDPAVRQFFWQSLAYLIALYITFSMMLTVNLMVLIGGVEIISRVPYGFWVYSASVSNLQGFSNFLVYCRPRFLKWVTQVMQRRREKKKQTETTQVESRVDSTSVQARISIPTIESGKESKNPSQLPSDISKSDPEPHDPDGCPSAHSESSGGKKDKLLTDDIDQGSIEGMIPRGSYGILQKESHTDTI